MDIIITSLDVEESAGSFEEWANNSEEQKPDDIDRWREAYNIQMVKELKKRFPSASIQFGEGTDQRMKSKIRFEWKESTNGKADYNSPLDRTPYTEEWLEGGIREDVETIMEKVGNDGSFWK